MKKIFILCLLPFLCLGSEKEKDPERIGKDQLLHKDILIRYTPEKPCWLDKYQYLCCPVRKLVRRKTGKEQWTDYYYNEKEELIGIRKGNHSGVVKRSDFSSISGCSRCMSTKIRQRTWKHNTRPKLAPPKKKKNRR